MTEANSPRFRAGQIHGAYDAAYPARIGAGPHPALELSTMYLRGYAWGWASGKHGAPVRPINHNRTDGR